MKIRKNLIFVTIALVDNALLIILLVPVSRFKLQSEIQKIIETGCSGLNNTQRYVTIPSDLPQGVPVDDMFGMEKNFDFLLTTIHLFVEQEPFINVPMNLDKNF